MLSIHGTFNFGWDDHAGQKKKGWLNSRQPLARVTLLGRQVLLVGGREVPKHVAACCPNSPY